MADEQGKPLWVNNLEAVLEGLHGEVIRQERNPKYYQDLDIAMCDDARDYLGEIANALEWGEANRALIRTRAAEAAALAIRLILRADEDADNAGA